MNAVLTVLDDVDKQGEVTRIGLEARIALEDLDTPRASTLYRQAAVMMESAVGSLKKPSERDLARFLVATHYYLGGHYDEAVRVCKTIQEKRLPSNVRHLYPPFFKDVKERSAPDYAARYRRQIDRAHERATKERDRAAAQRVIELLREHPYLIPRDEMASVWAECCDILGRQRAASLFYRAAWQFSPENPHYLSCYLDSLGKEGRHAEAWSIVEDQLVNHPGVPSSVNALHVINAMLRASRRKMSVMDEEEVTQRRVELLRHFEAALISYRSLSSAERLMVADWMEYAFMIAFVASAESKDAGNQLETLNRWIELRPESPYPHVLRGMMTYPGDVANADFREAIRLEQSPDPYPYYFLAHEALKSGDFQECDRLSTLALERNPDSEVRAALLSWQAISRRNLGFARAYQVRKLLEEAMRLKPDDPLIAGYAKTFHNGEKTQSLPASIRREGEKRTREQARRFVEEFLKRGMEDLSPAPGSIAV